MISRVDATAVRRKTKRGRQLVCFYFGVRQIRSYAVTFRRSHAEYRVGVASSAVKICALPVFLHRSMESRVGFNREEINSTIWEVPDKYICLKQIGTGAYGSVWWVPRVGALPDRRWQTTYQQVTTRSRTRLNDAVLEMVMGQGSPDRNSL